MGNRVMRFKQPITDSNGKFIQWHFWELGDDSKPACYLDGRRPPINLQSTGILDSKRTAGFPYGQSIYVGDIIEFWAIYPTTQTHVGDNIPRGSYTEPDEPVFEKIKGVVYYDLETASYSFSIVGKAPYQFGGFGEFNWTGGDIVPIIGRCEYNLDYLRHYMGLYNENGDNSEYLEWIVDCTGMCEEDFIKVINDIEVVGNIHQPDLLP